MSRNQNSLVMLVNAITSPDSLEHRHKCASSSTRQTPSSFLSCFPFCLLLTVFSPSVILALKYPQTQTRGTEEEEEGSVYEDAPRVCFLQEPGGPSDIIPLGTIQISPPKMFPSCFAGGSSRSFMDSGSAPAHTTQVKISR